MPQKRTKKRLSRKLWQDSLSHWLKPSHVSNNTGQPPALEAGNGNFNFEHQLLGQMFKI